MTGPSAGGSAFHAASAFAHLGLDDEVIAALERAHVHGFANAVAVETDPAFARLIAAGKLDAWLARARAWLEMPPRCPQLPVPRVRLGV